MVRSMEPDQAASQTALGSACLRAVHQLLDAAPRILEDPLALPLLGPDMAAQIQAQRDEYQTPAMQVARAHVVLRSRFAEDRLAAAVSRGVTQFVILGAGFDTFALRQPPWAHGLNVLEVDHRETQWAKRLRIDAAQLTVPTNVSFAAVDFERQSLREGLLPHDVALDQPTVFSWLGVTMYLQEAAIDATLKFVSEFAAGSEIVLTFAQPLGDRGEPESLFAARAAELGEPFISFFTPPAMEAKLRRAGFSSVEFLSPQEAEIRYFSQRPRDLPVPRRTAIVAARV